MVLVIQSFTLVHHGVWEQHAVSHNVEEQRTEHRFYRVWEGATAVDEGHVAAGQDQQTKVPGETVGLADPVQAEIVDERQGAHGESGHDEHDVAGQQIEAEEVTGVDVDEAQNVIRQFYEENGQWYAPDGECGLEFPRPDHFQVEFVAWKRRVQSE